MPPPPPPSTTTIIDRLTGLPIRGAAAPNIQSDGYSMGRRTRNSVNIISNNIARLNRALSDSRIWRGAFYQNQGTLSWRAHGGNGEIQKSSELYKNWFNKTPTGTRGNNTIPRPSPGSENDLANHLYFDLDRRRQFRTAKEFWQFFPPQLGCTFYTNFTLQNALEDYLEFQGGLDRGNLNFSNADSLLDQVRNQVNIFSRFVQGPQSWLDQQGGIALQYRWLRFFLRIPNRWNYADDFEFPYPNSNIIQHGYLRRTNFNRNARGGYQYRTNDYLLYKDFKISRDDPARPDSNKPGIYIDDGGGNIPGLTLQQTHAEQITDDLYKEFKQIYGPFITNQIQMPTNPRTRFYKDLRTSPIQYLTRPNQLLYNIAVEIVRSRYYWNPALPGPSGLGRGNFDLTYLRP